MLHCMVVSKTDKNIIFDAFAIPIYRYYKCMALINIVVFYIYNMYQDFSTTAYLNARKANVKAIDFKPGSLLPSSDKQ